MSTIPEILLPDVSVLIVNFNGGEYLAGCLKSLEAQTYQNFEVILVDNASTDGSVDNLQSAPGKSFTVIRSDDNLGFAAGNNLAAKQAKGRWLALLNPDAEAAPDWIEAIFNAETRYPGVTSFASAQFDLHNAEQLDGVGDNYLVWGIPWRGGFGRPATELPKEGECFSPCGAGAIYRKDVFDEFRGFDERYFCFCEDVDLGYRLRNAGHVCVFDPAIQIHHAGGGLAGRVSDFAVYHGARNRLWMYLKCTPMWLLILTLPVHILLTLAILARGLMTGRFASTLRGVWHGLKGMGPFWKDREDAVHPGRRRVGDSTSVRLMAWNPLLLFRHASVIKPVRLRGQSGSA